jgi:hypothetical protein
MVTEYVYHDTEDHFSDRTSMISGIATLRLDVEDEFSADIGGVDGRVVSARLIEVKVGTLIFTADQIAEAFGAGVVARFESQVADWEDPV